MMTEIIALRLYQLQRTIRKFSESQKHENYSDGFKWWIDKNKLIILERYSKMNIISFDGMTMKYMQKRTFARDEIYTAERVNN